jgi:hypothetical protein
VRRVPTNGPAVGSPSDPTPRASLARTQARIPPNAARLAGHHCAPRQRHARRSSERDCRRHLVRTNSPHRRHADTQRDPSPSSTAASRRAATRPTSVLHSGVAPEDSSTHGRQSTATQVRPQTGVAPTRNATYVCPITGTALRDPCPSPQPRRADTQRDLRPPHTGVAPLATASTQPAPLLLRMTPRTPLSLAAQTSSADLANPPTFSRSCLLLVGESTLGLPHRISTAADRRYSAPPWPSNDLWAGGGKNGGWEGKGKIKDRSSRCPKRARSFGKSIEGVVFARYHVAVNSSDLKVLYRYHGPTVVAFSDGESVSPRSPDLRAATRPRFVARTTLVSNSAFAQRLAP